MQSDNLSAPDTENPNTDSSQSFQGSRGGNGFDSVASQYRAMQEAQLLHEETINQLREEVRGQRERLSEFAKSSPTQRTGQLEMIMLRLTELERKIGEGAPDPLLNEIVHRLASLENAGPMRGMKDSRVDDVLSQLEGLRQKVANAGGQDSRTDDVVLRIASLEGAFRRAAQSRDPEEVRARIDELSQELADRQSAELDELRGAIGELARSTAEASAGAAGAATSSEELEKIAGRLSAIEQQLAEARPKEQLTYFGDQLAALDRKLSAQSTEEIESRVRVLEERGAQDNTNEVIELIADRVAAVEEKLEAVPGDGALDQLQQFESRLVRVEDSSEVQAIRERVAQLVSEMEDSGPAQRLLELSGRVRGLEVRLDAAPSSEKAVHELRERLARLEESLNSKPSSEDLVRLEGELRALKTKTQDAGPATLPADLTTKLADLEERLSEKESSSRLEDADTRLAALETRLGGLGEPAEISRRLTLLEMNPSPADPRLEDVLNRLGALESKPFETLSDTRIHELRDSVADLHAELETVSKERLPLLTELPERLSLLEARVRDAATTSGSPDPAGQALLTGLEHQIRSLSEKVEGLGNSPAEPALDPRVSELLARIEWVERNGSSASTMSDVELEAIKRRLDVMEEAIAAGPGSSNTLPAGIQTELAARLNAIEHALGNLEEGSSAAGATAGATAELEAALKRETDRWNQFARNTIQEIAEMRDNMEGGVPSGASGTGIDAESAEALAVQITTGLNNSEVKALRGQMYFVYLSIGVLWAILLYVLFAQ